MEHNENTPENSNDSAVVVPVLPLRDVVVYPHMVIPLFVGREKSIRALEAAMDDDKRILLVAQKSAEVDDPQVDDIHELGTLSTILQLLKLPDGTVKVLVEGAERAAVTQFETTEEFFSAQIEVKGVGEVGEEREVDVLMRSLLTLFDQYVKLNKKVPPEILTSLSGIDEPGRLADTIAAHMALKLEEKQRILEIENVRERLEHLMGMIEAEIDVLQIEKRIRGRVKQQMEKSQREYYLNEQMKAIQKELGEMEDVPNETDELQGKILIDVTVPLVPPKVGTVQLPEEGSAGKRAQEFLGEDVRVVSAFQNIAAHLLQQDVHIECDVLVAGNKKDARQQVIDLIEQAGMTGWHAGPIANAAAAEALTSILIQINRQGQISHAGIKIVGQGDH